MLVSWLFPLGKGESSLFSCCWQGCFWFPMVRISSQSGLEEHGPFTKGECLCGSCYACFNVMPVRHGGQQELSGTWSGVTRGCPAPGPAQGQCSPALGTALSTEPRLSSSTSAGNRVVLRVTSCVCAARQATAFQNQGAALTVWGFVSLGFCSGNRREVIGKRKHRL